MKVYCPVCEKMVQFACMHHTQAEIEAAKKKNNKATTGTTGASNGGQHQA